MSLEITNNYGNYAKNGTSTTQESNVTTSTVELKTSKPEVTRAEQIKTGYDNVNDYSKYLQGKYSYMNTGTISIQGVPTIVSVSGAFLQKCMNDPEKAKYLEENLAAIPDCVSYAKSHALGTVTSISYEIGADGSITGIMSGTNDPDGKIAKENAMRRAKEKKAAEEKADKRREEKKAEEEKIAKQRADRKRMESTCAVSATGMDIKSVTQNVIAAVSGIWSPAGSAFDIKA